VERRKPTVVDLLERASLKPWTSLWWGTETSSIWQATRAGSPLFPFKLMMEEDQSNKIWVFEPEAVVSVQSFCHNYEKKNKLVCVLR
jgi:hypothetical protein